MSVSVHSAIDEAAYARALHRSAAETARRLLEGEIAEETRNWGSLKAKVRDELDQHPVTAEAIAVRLGKSKGNVICSLRRLEDQGLARRAGKVAGLRGQPVTTWVRAGDD
jgi:DNA-binding transcriptional regulator GbsR (MarR family)